MSRKIAVIVLSIMTLALLGVGVVILLQLQQDQSPDEADAAGFGSTAVRTNFDLVEQAFNEMDCTWYLNQEMLTNTGDQALDQLGREYSHGYIRRLEVDHDFAKNCFYFFSEDPTIPNPEDFRIIHFYVSAYEMDAVIDNSAEELYQRVNTDTIIRVVDEGQIRGETIRYFYGDSDIEGVCQANIFHNQNDFEYASILYSQFGPCSQNIELNKRITYLIADKLEKVMQPFILEQDFLEIEGLE